MLLVRRTATQQALGLEKHRTRRLAGCVGPGDRSATVGIRWSRSTTWSLAPQSDHAVCVTASGVIHQRGCREPRGRIHAQPISARDGANSLPEAGGAYARGPRPQSVTAVPLVATSRCVATCRPRPALCSRELGMAAWLRDCLCPIPAASLGVDDGEATTASRAKHASEPSRRCRSSSSWCLCTVASRGSNGSLGLVVEAVSQTLRGWPVVFAGGASLVTCPWWVALSALWGPFQAPTVAIRWR